MKRRDSDRVVLVGQIVPLELRDDPEAIQILVSDGGVIDVPLELEGFLEFVSVPKRYPEALGYVRDAGGTQRDLDSLISSGRLMVVRDRKGAKYLHSFSGYRLVPMGVPVGLIEASDGVVWVGEFADSARLLPVLERTAAVMWGAEPGEDVPQTILRLSAEADEDQELWQRSLKFNIFALIEYGLAFIAEVEK